MPAMKVSDMIKEIEAQGWVYACTEGDHHHSRHPERKGKVTVPGKASDTLPAFFVASVRRQASGHS